MKFGVKAGLSGDPQQAKEKFSYLMSKGITSCQLAYKPEVWDPEVARQIRAVADEVGMEISAHFIGYRDGCCQWDMRYDFLNAGINSPFWGGARISYILAAIPFVQALGITDVILHAGHISADPFSDSYNRMVAAVGLIANRFKAAGLNLLFETGPEAPITLLRLIREVGTGNLFVNLDTANIIMYGCGNPVDALTTIGPYVRNTHFKDGLPPTDPYLLGPETPIGQGNVDFPKVVKLLKGLNYDRFITIEHELSEDEEAILKGIEYIKALWYADEKEQNR